MKINQRDDKGRHHGYWVEYYFSGQLWYKGEFKNGKQHGLWEYYWYNGQLYYKGEYKQGKNIGLWYKERYD